MEPPHAGPTAPPRARSSSSSRARNFVSPPLPPADGFPKKSSPRPQNPTADHQVISNSINTTPFPKGPSISEGTNRNRSIHRSKTQPIPINGVRTLQREEEASKLGLPSNCVSSPPKETNALAALAKRQHSLDRRSRREKNVHPLVSSVKVPRESSVASASPSRKVFKFLESRQNSFSSYLSQSRKESVSPSDKSNGPPQPPGILVSDRNDSGNLVLKSGSLQEIGSSLESSTDRRRKKDCIRRSVHFPDNEVESFKRLGDEPELPDSLETLKKHGSTTVSPSGAANSQLKKDEIQLESVARPKRGVQKSSSTSFEGLSFPKKVTFQSPPETAEKIQKYSTTTYESGLQGTFSSRLKYSNFNLESSSRNSSGITRIGGVHSIQPLISDKYNIPDSNSHQDSKSSQLLLDPSLNSTHSKGCTFSFDDRPENTLNEDTCVSRDQAFATLPRRNPVHKNSVARQLSKEEESFNPPINIKRRVIAASTEANSPENNLPEPLSRSQITNSKRENLNNVQETPPQNRPPVETRSKKLAKSSSTSTFRFFPQNIQLPLIPNKPSRRSSKEKSSTSTAARSAFFSELTIPLSPELADYLYDKMKGTHEGILVTACRLAEEDQVLKLIKELTTGGILDDGLVNQRDRTGRTALSYACVNGFTRAVVALSAVPSADLNLADSEGNTPLHLAAQAGHPDVVSHLVNKCGVELDPRNSVGFTPLMKAALQGRTKIAKTLLFAGASPHLRDFGRGLSALEWARFTGRHLCCDLIESVERSCSDSVREKWTSDPDLNATSTSASGEHRDSWLRHKFKRAFTTKPDPRKVGYTEYRVVSNLPHLAKCATSPLLPPAAAASVAAASRVNVIPSLQVTEVKVADCYQDPEETLKRTTLSSPPDVSPSQFSPPASSSGNNPTVVGPPPSSKFVKRDSPIPTQRNTRKESSSQNNFKNEAPTPLNSPARHSEVGGPSEKRFHESRTSTTSRSVDHNVQEDNPNSSALPQNRRTSSVSSLNSTGKSKPFVSGIISSKPPVSQSVVAQTSGGRVVTGSVYSKTASVYTVQKSASVTKYSSSGPSKFPTTANSEDNPNFRTSSLDFDVGYSSSEKGGVAPRQRDPANDVRFRNSADHVTKK